MAIIRCKMCGGELEITDESSICECEFCGTKQTIPTIKDENLQGLFNRANNLRMKAEFDKAAEIYEKIIQADESESEAYWGLILCKYGIEYVEDPATYKRVPTCHRASFEAVTVDDDYKKALEYADTLQKSVYEAEAKAIDEIQKGIVALAQKEDPYDVFICYKETDAEGKRTQDSAIANDIYYQLTQEGFKVFYAAITLEDKLGQEYEPYIFSALNSSKVMLSLGTKPEYFNAVWVKNEWSRFLKIMKKDRSRLLIPCYKGMDAYELPEEFAHLQAQDMGKIGFINDVVRGIKKVISKDSDKPKVVEQVVQQSAGSTSANAQVQRGNMALEDNEWEKAEGFFEEALNLDPQCAEAYLGKLMAKEKCSNVAELTQHYISKYESSKSETLEACPEDSSRIDKAVSQYKVSGFLSDNEIRRLYEFNRTYVSELSFRKKQKTQELSELAEEKLLTRANQYASGETKTILDKLMEDITATLDKRIEDAEKNDDECIAELKSSYEKHLNKADEKAEKLYNNALEKQESTYNSNVTKMNTAESISDFEQAKNSLKSMLGYKDTDELAKKCQAEIDRMKEEERLKSEREATARREEAARKAKKNKTITAIVAAVVVVAIASYIVVTKVVIPNCKYNDAVALMNNGKYEEAIAEFEALGVYKDSADQINNCKYDNAVALMNSGRYEDAIEGFKSLDGYKDSEKMLVTLEFGIISKSSVGDSITFGNYKGNTKWIVLAKENGKVLVISKYAIETRPYNTKCTSVTWENCSLRSWLNEEYITSAFCSDEQSRIVEASTENPDNASYGTYDGNNAVDKVLLLSIEEVKKYFTSDSDRKATLSDGMSVCWWLRSPGGQSNFAARVNSDGSVNEHGIYVDSEYIAVRPAMWISID